MTLGNTNHQFKFSVNYSMDLFGVTIDKDLTLKRHTSFVCKKSKQSLHHHDNIWQTHAYCNHVMSLQDNETSSLFLLYSMAFFLVNKIQTNWAF